MEGCISDRCTKNALEHERSKSKCCAVKNALTDLVAHTRGGWPTTRGRPTRCLLARPSWQDASWQALPGRRGRPGPAVVAGPARPSWQARPGRRGRSGPAGVVLLHRDSSPAGRSMTRIRLVAAAARKRLSLGRADGPELASVECWGFAPWRPRVLKSRDSEMLLSLQVVHVSSLIHKNDTGDIGCKIQYQTAVSSYWLLVSGILLTLLVRRLRKPFGSICYFPLAAWSLVLKN
jgi:hypothetical protein